MARSLVSVSDLGRDGLATIGGRTAQLLPAGAATQSLAGLQFAGLFLEASTRTRLAFESAARRLGAGFSLVDRGSSSIAKGESFRDTLDTLQATGFDAVIVRSPWSGLPLQLLAWSGLPIVNAGDGTREHPTQAIGDVILVAQHFKRELDAGNAFDGLTFAIVGDVKHSRVARSLAALIDRLGGSVRLVGPPAMLADPRAFGARVGATEELAPGIAGVDVVYMLRVQRERLAEGEWASFGSYQERYQLNRERLAAAGDIQLVMHPGPVNRGVELTDEIFADSRFAASRQVEMGAATRMAVLEWVMERL